VRFECAVMLITGCRMGVNRRSAFSALLQAISPARACARGNGRCNR